MKKYRLIHQNSNIEAPEGRFDIGRSIECSLVLDDPSVSRVHATIVFKDEQLILEDRGSRNGCLINGTRISGNVRLNDGDRISIGHQTIRVVALEKIANADKTLGLTTCKSCGAWIASNEKSCGNCGEPKDMRADPRETFTNIDPPKQKSPQKLTQQPQMMLAAIIRKAISMDRFEESEKMLANLMESAISKAKAGGISEEKEMIELGLTTIALAEATHTPRHVSTLFAFHRAHGSLMPRETVEALYGVVRSVGYRACPEMTRYLTMLSEMSNSLTPGQKFVHRRLEGLVGVCS